VHRQIDVHSARMERLTTEARAALSEETFNAAMAEGRSMDIATAVAYVRRSRGLRGRPALGWDSLTPTELSVLDLVAEGLTNPQIAERLLIARNGENPPLTYRYKAFSPNPIRTGPRRRRAHPRLT
jgi:DNA-binding NarL/FixJ family response regulator